MLVLITVVMILMTTMATNVRSTNEVLDAWGVGCDAVCGVAQGSACMLHAYGTGLEPGNGRAKGSASRRTRGDRCAGAWVVPMGGWAVRWLPEGRCTATAQHPHR